MSGHLDPDQDYAAWFDFISHGGRATERHLTAEFRKRRLLLPKRTSDAKRPLMAALDARKPPRRIKRLTGKARAWLHGLRAGLATRRAVKRQRQGHAGQAASPTLALPPPPVTRSEHVAEVPERPLSPWEQMARETGHRP